MSANPDGQYETLGEETFFQSGEMITDTDASLYMQYDLRIVRYVKNNLKEKDQADPRIALRIYKKGKSNDGKDTGGKCEHEFKMAIGKFQQIMELLDEENTFLLAQSVKALRSTNMLEFTGNTPTFNEWLQAKETLLRYLAEHGWHIGRSVPLTSEDRDAVRTGARGGNFHLDIVSFINPSSRDRILTKDTMNLSIYQCNTEQEVMLFRKFIFTQTKRERCGLLASIILPCLSFQRITGAFSDKKDRVILISPAFHALLKYYRTPGNVLQRVMPQSFAAPITFELSSEQQQHMIYHPVNPEEKLLMQMQMENLQYMNTRSSCHVMPVLQSFERLLTQPQPQPALPPTPAPAPTKSQLIMSPLPPPPPPPPPPTASQTSEVDGSVVVWDRDCRDDGDDDAPTPTITSTSTKNKRSRDFFDGGDAAAAAVADASAPIAKKSRSDANLEKEIIEATKEIIDGERKKRDNDKKLYNVM